MADYIDRQTIIEAIHSAIYPFFCGAEDGDELSEDEKLVLSVNKAICTAIKAFPSADVQPVRHGRWEIYQLAELGQAWTIQCSVCHAIGFHGKTPYCCECGARMDSE